MAPPDALEDQWTTISYVALPYSPRLTTRQLPRSGPPWHRRPCARGDVVFAEGEAGDRLFVVLDGKVKLGQTSGDGREQVLAVLGPGEMFGELSLFDPGPRTSTATAVTDSVLLGLGQSDLRPWLTGRPEVAEALLQALAQRLRRTNEAMADLVFSDVPVASPKRCSSSPRSSARDSPTARGSSPMTSPRKSWPNSSGHPARRSTSHSPTSPNVAGCGWRLGQ